MRVQEKETKQRLLDYLCEITETVGVVPSQKLTASEIATQLNLSRTLVSQYLNEAVQEGLVFKVNSRPVYFYHCKALGLSEAVTDLPTSLDSVEQLAAIVEQSRDGNAAFAELTGIHGSLSYAVEQCKAAMNYPGSGLPVLILGPTGTGKSFLAELMHRYACSNGILKPNSRFVSLNCAEYSNNPELFLTNFFGHTRGAYTGADKERKGLVALADNGVLFLDEVHSLSSECQEKLFHFLDNGSYHMVGDNERWYKACVHMIMATTESPEMSLLKTLLRRIPVVIQLVPLSERPIEEKKELLYKLLRGETDRIGYETFVSERVYHCLAGYEFEGNVGQAVNCIRACVANAYLEATSEKKGSLEIYLHHLPNYVLRSTAVGLSRNHEGRLLSLTDLHRELQTDKKILTFNRDIISQYEKFSREETSPQDFVVISKARLSQYLDDRCLENADENPREALYTDIVRGVCSSVGKRVGILFRTQDVLNAGQLIGDYLIHRSWCDQLGCDGRDTLSSLMSIFRGRDKQHGGIAEEIIREVGISVGKPLGEIGQLDAFICLEACIPKAESRKMLGILMAHGYSTASSMAFAINQLLGEHVFDAIDMPADISPLAIRTKLSARLRMLNGARDVLLLVDMGSLEQIYKELDGVDNMNLGVIGDMTMKVALGAGSKIQQDLPLKEIVDNFRDVATHHGCAYLGNRRKDDAILTVCATGMGTAEKISELFVQSLPARHQITVVPYNYSSLASAGRNSPVFDKYHVLFVVGTHDPGIEGCHFIGIEDLIEQKNSDVITAILGQTLSEPELCEFNDRMVRNFSLINVVDHLTVLNPDKVVGFAEEIIANLQSRMGVIFQNKTTVGLYIHICCLIERLLTDRHVVTYEHLESFEREQQEFIRHARKSFAEVERHYGIEIPVGELGYLYEYIKAR